MTEKELPDGVATEHDLIIEGCWDEGRQPVVIFVSVKSRLRERHVEAHLADLAQVYELYPRFRGADILGGIGAVSLPDSVRRHAQKKGLFVFHVSEDVARIVNDAKFRPKNWSPVAQA